MEFLEPSISKPRNFKLVISYDGTDFLGWQKTAFGLSVEALLQEALEKILSEKVTLQAASRTDRGVHAKGQVVNFFSTKMPSKYSLNAILPKTIRVLQIDEVDLSFHPTLDAKGKEYHYYITMGPIQEPIKRLYSWHIPQYLDLNKIYEAIPYFVGKKDFSSLCNTRRDIEKTAKVTEIFNIKVDKTEQQLCFVITGKRFLYKMVRNIVGTLVVVGKGNMEPKDIPVLLEKKDRKLLPMTSPAHGLFLVEIFYG